MSKRGKRIAKSLKELIDAIESDKPLKQSTLRRMNVKVKIVYTREAFKTPIVRRS